MKATNCICLLFLLAFSLNSFSSSVNIILNDNTEYTLILDKIASITFNGSSSELYINMNDESNYSFSISEIRKLTFGNLVGISSKEFDAIRELSFISNYPNPFRDKTTIFYELEYSAFVTVEICDSMGRFIDQIEQGEKTPGSYSIVWNGKNHNGIRVSTGIYYCCIKTNKQKATNLMLYIK